MFRQVTVSFFLFSFYKRFIFIFIGCSFKNGHMGMTLLMQAIVIVAIDPLHAVHYVSTLMSYRAELCLLNRAHFGVKGGIYPTITLSSFFQFHYFVVSITKKWSACRPLITQLFLFPFCIFFSSALLSFPFLLFFCIIAKLRFSMHEGSANTHSRTMAADAKLQKCMRRARGLQQRMQQQQEQQQEPSRPQGPTRYLYCHPVCPA